MPLSKFVQASADRQEALEDLSKELQPEIAKRFRELLKNPKRINNEIILDFIQDGLNVMIEETGNRELAEAFWNQVADMIAPVDVLAATPVEQRGDVWNAAMSTLVSVAQIQAEIESGLFQTASIIGIESGAELGKLTKGIPNSRLKKATFNIKPELKRRKNDRKKQEATKG